MRPCIRRRAGHSLVAAVAIVLGFAGSAFGQTGTYRSTGSDTGQAVLSGTYTLTDIHTGRVTATLNNPVLKAYAPSVITAGGADPWVLAYWTVTLPDGSERNVAVDLDLQELDLGSWDTPSAQGKPKPPPPPRPRPRPGGTDVLTGGGGYDT